METLAPSATAYVSSAASGFSVPAKHNPKLQAIVARVNADEELHQLWRCANVMANERLGLSDHGETHVRIVANAGLRLLRLLMEAGLPASLVTHHNLAREEAEVAVVLAAALHDLGLVAHYERHAELGLGLVYHKARELLNGVYGVRERTLLTAEVLHCAATHFDELRALTLEASVLKIADGLDMTKGRSRAPSGTGQLFASTIEEVTLHRGEARPVRIEIRMNSADGIFYANELLRPRLEHSTLANAIEVVAQIDNGREKRRVTL